MIQNPVVQSGSNASSVDCVINVSGKGQMTYYFVNGSGSPQQVDQSHAGDTQNVLTGSLVVIIGNLASVMSQTTGDVTTLALDQFSSNGAWVLQVNGPCTIG